MSKTILFSVVLTVFSLFTGCQSNETDNSLSESVNTTTETVTESDIVIDNMTEPPVTTYVTEPFSESSIDTESSAESSTAAGYSYETYSAEMNMCKKKGEISGENVGGYIAVFNEQIGDYSYTGTTLENQQQIVAVRSYRYKDRTWYALYDMDYNVS